MATSESNVSSNLKQQIDYHKFLPIVAPFLILLGITKQICIYDYFNIDIVPFLEFPEILTSFLSDVILWVMGLAFFIFWMYPMLHGIFLHRLNSKVSTILALSFCMIFSFIVSVAFGNWSKELIFESCGFCAILIGFTSLYSIRPIYFQFKKLQSVHTILFALIFILILTIYFSRRFSILAKQYKSTNGVKVVLDSLTIISDSSYFYIGKTNKYVFFYSETEHKSVIYPMSRVKEITFPNRH